MMGNKYQLNFSDDTQQAISKLVDKYSLRFDPNADLLERLEKEDPELVIFKLAKKILNREGSFGDISEMLKKDLRIPQEKADELAQDIKNKIVPLTDIIVPEEPKREPVAVVPPAPKLPYGKKIEIENVEENARIMAEAEGLRKTRTVISQEVNRKPTDGTLDPYKEALE